MAAPITSYGTTGVTVEVDPISRIEGHLGVKLTTDATGVVTEADVHGNLWRGFENFLIGRNPNDAITFTQRICGVCPVPHGTASTYAIDAVYGYNSNFQTFVAGGNYTANGSNADVAAVPAGQGVPAKAVHIRNLVLSAEFLMSHITHSYHLAAPSYIQGPPIPPWTPYFADSYYHPFMLSAGKTLPVQSAGFSSDLWSAVITQYVKALRIRRLTFEAGALFAGRMPMTSALVAGGVLNDKSESLGAKCTKFRNLIAEVGTFIVKEFVPTFLALGALYPNYDNLANATLLGGVNLTVGATTKSLWEWADATNTLPVTAAKTRYGAGVGNFLAWGAFPQADGTLGMVRGYKLSTGSPVLGITTADVLANLREHISSSRYAGSWTLDPATDAPVFASATITDPATEARTEPERNTSAKYSWLKAPRWNGNAMEVGPFARMVVGSLYPVDEVTTLATQPNLSPLYGLYLRGVDAVTLENGIDPRMVEADLAVSLVRMGLATLKTSLDNGATVVTVDNTNIGTLSNAQILAGYTYANPAGVAIRAAYISGIIFAWLTNVKGGLSIMDRLRGRALEALTIVLKMIGAPSKTSDSISWPAMGGWVGALNGAIGDTYISKAVPTGKVFGFGATEAPRGALMHMATIKGGKILKYQCIVPTTWNGSPKGAGTAPDRGPIEQAMIGIPYSLAGASFTNVAGGTTTTGGGVEALRVAQSFDPCIACAVH